MEWIKIELRIDSDDFTDLDIEELDAKVEILNNLVLNIHPKKSISSVWYRTIKYTLNTYYEVLLPKPSESNILILKDFGYRISYEFVTRKERREYYKRLKQ